MGIRRSQQDSGRGFQSKSSNSPEEKKSGEGVAESEVRGV